MKLSNLELTLGKKKISIEINEEGIRIKPLEELTMHELQYMSAISFVYIGSKIYGRDYKVSEILSRGYKMYKEYHAIMKKKGLNGPEIEL